MLAHWKRATYCRYVERPKTAASLPTKSAISRGPVHPPRNVSRQSELTGYSCLAFDQRVKEVRGHQVSQAQRARHEPPRHEVVGPLGEGRTVEGSDRPRGREHSRETLQP